MTITELGAIGEFIGSIAVLVTLGFFTLQFRQYRQSLSSSTVHGTIQQMNQLNVMLAADPDLAEILERAYADPTSLDDREQRRYVWMQTCYVNILKSLLDQYREGACREQFILHYAYQIKWALGTPGGKLWRERSTAYPDVLTYVDSLPEVEQAPVPFSLT
jgi:hypothetical protein